MSRRLLPHAESAVAGAAAALGVWLVQPSVGWALVSFGLGAFAAVFATRVRRGFLAGVALVGLLGATTAGVTSIRVRAVEQHWGDVREGLIRDASLRFAATLESAVNLARTLADRGLETVSDSQGAAFDRLARAVGRGGPEAGVVVFDTAGRPWSWAGRHRIPAVASNRELYARITPFYVVLEARRQTGARVAVGDVLLAADSAVPDRSQSVASRFTASTGAALEFYAPGSAPFGTDVFDYCLPSCTRTQANVTPDTLFSVRTAPPAQGTFKLSLLASGGRSVAIAVLACLVGLLATGERRSRYLALGILGATLLFTPLGLRLGLRTFFSPATYYFGPLDPFTASAGALALSGILGIAGVVALRARPPRAVIGTVAGVIALLVTPHAALELSRGIAPPAHGIGLGAWLGWGIPLAIGVDALVALVAALLPQIWRPGMWEPWAAVACAVGSALVGLVVWRPEAGWPGWYPYVWLPAILLAAQSGVRMRQVVAGGVVAASAAAILTWGAAVDGRLRLARADAQQLGGGGERDPLAIALLERIEQEPGPAPRTTADLYALWQRSPLAAAGYPAVLAVWGSRSQLIAELPMANLDLPARLMQAYAHSASERGESVLEAFDRVPGAYAVLARRFADGSVMTVGIGPRTRLITPLRVARIVRPEQSPAAPYEMSLSDVAPEPGWQPGLIWRRENQDIHGDERLVFPRGGGARHLHVSVDLGELPGLLIRGSLLLFLNASVAVLLWLFGEALLGRTDFVDRVRALLRPRSYRVRIAFALAVFFIVPTVGFAAWMAGRLQSDSARSQDLVIRQSLRDASGAVSDRRGGASDPLAAVADRFGGELLLYRGGALDVVSAPLLTQLGLIDVFLPPPVYRDLLGDEGGEAIGNLKIAGQVARVGFHALGEAGGAVLAIPRFADDQPLGEGDLAYALLLATVIGLGAAAALARAAARSLAEPVGVLRAAAELIGRGGTPTPFAASVPEEFVPVAEAFTRMAMDVRASQNALEAAQQRTVAVLRNIATGVVALTPDLRVTIANPRAEELLGSRLEPGALVAEHRTGDWAPVWKWVREFARSGADLSGRELDVGGRRIRVRASALGTEAGGCVVAIDDVTELTHAVRVLAWGEIARQVAHEIKNPLTPMRLGIQHLQRAFGEPRGDFAQALERTSRQILSEIDRLDAVARAFARFGAPPAEPDLAPPVAVDLVAVAHEAAALYALGGDSGVEVDTAGVVQGVARPEELREVLVNLVENARDAGASHIILGVHRNGAARVAISVKDDGRGILAADLPRIFEPHFSTRTSGTGLGLAICRRLVESWGGTIGVESEPEQGTTVTIEVTAGRVG